MLHRRPGHGSISQSGPSSSSNSGIATPASPSSSQANTNKAYTPLRRQSSGLYSSQTPASGQKAKYNVPSLSPGLVPGGPGIGVTIPSPLYGRGSSAAGPSSPGYFPSQGNTLGLGGYGNGYSYGNKDSGSLSDAWDDGAEGILRAGRAGSHRLRKGLEDALRLDRSWTLVWSDRELRNLVLKSTLINILSLLLLSLSSLIFSPFLVSNPTAGMQSRTREIGMWYNVLLSWPVFVLCFWINASWGPDISRRAQMMLHPIYRHQPSPSSTPTTSSSTSKTNTSNPYAWVFAAIARVLLISDFTLVSRLLRLVPLIGRSLAFTYMCIINAYYCFEWTFSSKQWPLDYRVEYMQDRTAYMLGFGFVATLLTSFGPPLVNMAIFAVIYPFFVIQALQSRPPAPSKSSLLPATPSPHASLPPSPSGGAEMSLNDPFFDTRSRGTRAGALKGAMKVPIFVVARYALEGVQWLEAALARDRRGSGVGADAIGLGLRNVGIGRERAGKRAM